MLLQRLRKRLGCVEEPREELCENCEITRWIAAAVGGSVEVTALPPMPRFLILQIFGNLAKRRQTGC